MKIKKYFRIIIIFFFAVAFWAAPICFAESYDLPQPFYSSDGSDSSGVVVTTGDTGVNATPKYYYGGYTGNEAVFNFNPNTSSSISRSVGFDRQTLYDCYNNIFRLDVCFVPSTFGLPFEVMSGKTSVNGIMGNEIATLLYASNISEGDIYGDDVLSNFNVYGRNLNLNSAASNASWDVQGYSLNATAQSYYDPANASYYNARIETLAGEAQDVSGSVLANSTLWYLENDDIVSSTAPLNLDPQGKVWHVTGNLGLSGSTTYKYKGKGTIIIDGYLNFNVGTNLQPADSSSHLGIIVRGINQNPSSDSYGDSIRITKTSQIQAAIFASGPIHIESTSGVTQNVKMIGSFVAKSFDISAGSRNIQFLYDFNLSNNWPPGFRYFNMPVAEEQ